MAAGATPALGPGEPTLTAALECPQGGHGSGHTPHRGTWVAPSGRWPGPPRGQALQADPRGVWGQRPAAPTSNCRTAHPSCCTCRGPGSGQGSGARIRAGPGESGWVDRPAAAVEPWEGWAATRGGRMAWAWEPRLTAALTQMAPGTPMLRPGPAPANTPISR